MNAITFSSLQSDTIHFKCAMNAIKWGSLQQCELTSFSIREVEGF